MSVTDSSLPAAVICLLSFRLFLGAMPTLVLFMLSQRQSPSSTVSSHQSSCSFFLENLSFPDEGESHITPFPPRLLLCLLLLNCCTVHLRQFSVDLTKCLTTPVVSRFAMKYQLARSFPPLPGDGSLPARSFLLSRAQ